MLYPTGIFLFYLLIAASLFSFSKEFFGYRFSLIILIILNLILILLASPFLILLISLEIILMLFVYFLITKYRFNDNYSWILMLPLIFLSGPIFDLPLTEYFKKIFSAITFNETPFKIGATFIILKSFISLKQWIKNERIYFLEALTALTFIPSLPAGPIHGCLDGKRIISKVD